MTVLTWTHSCSVGVRAMDEQHGILLDVLNDLRLAVLHGCGREQMSEQLEMLLKLARMHFQCEEHLMANAGYPDLDPHRMAHRRLLALLRESAHHAQYGTNVQMTPLLYAMRDGYLEHIESSDRHYGPWLNARGVE